MGDIKKICLIIPSLQACGGSERVITGLANHYALNFNLEVHLILLIKAERFFKVNNKVKIHEPNFDHKNKNKIYATLVLLYYLRKKIKEIKPFSLLSFEEMYNSFVILSTMFLNTKVFISDRSKPDKDWGLFHNTLRKWLYPFASGIIAQTNYAKIFLFKETKNKNICVINNPIKKIESNSNLTRENVILSVGRLIKSKNHDHIIDVFSKLNKPDWKLIIVGEGSERDFLEEKINDLGLNDRIKLVGNVLNIEYYYNTSKVFAFTSQSEGFPNALGEALSAGLVCISYDCVAGPSDLINDGVNGFLIEQNNKDELLARLLHLINNQELCRNLGFKAVQSTDKLNIKNIGEEYLKFILT